MRTRTPKTLTRVPADRAADKDAGQIRFESRGAVLVCGPASLAVPAGQLLAKTLRVVVCASGEVAQTTPRHNPVVMLGRIARIGGCLGRFKVEAWAGDDKIVDMGPFSGNPDNVFDLILDLNTTPLVDLEVKPLGYHAPESDPAALAAAIEDLSTLVGTFQKPRDVDYDETICVHSAQGVPGCSRCLTVCPAGAISSRGNRIEVDAGLCRGCGGCMVGCPTGALSHPSALPAVAAAGPELWLASLAGGIPEVVIPAPDDLPASTRQAIASQVDLARTLLTAIGELPERISLDGSAAVPTMAAAENPPAPSFLGQGIAGKRDTIHAALDCLQSRGKAHASGATLGAELPADAPFGTVEVDRSSCTLCMACANVCPTNALRSNDEKPGLGFVESKCVQCRICERTCPEQSIALKPRFLLDPDARHDQRMLNEDAPHPCPACNSPFTGQALLRRNIRAMEKLGLLSAEGLERLRYCPDCRISALC